MTIAADPNAKAGALAVRRFDIGELHGDASVDAAGMLRTPARLTRTGVFAYRLPDGTMRRELRHPAEVFDAASLATLAQVPVTLGHPPEWVTSDNAKKYGVGSTGERVDVEADRFVRARLLVSDGDAVRAVRDGSARQTSCGYTCTLDVAPGVHEGEAYDATQRAIRYNHVALVPVGRAGPEVRVMDGAQCPGEIPGAQRGETMAKIRIDGVEYEIADGAAGAVKAALDKRDALDVEAKAAGVKLATLQAKVDAVPDAAKLRGEIESQVRARVALESRAADVLGADHKCDGKSDDDVRKAVIAKLDPGARLDGKGADYVAARFDLAVEAHAEAAKRAANTSRTIAGSAAGTVDADDTGWAAACKATVERLANAGDPSKAW